MPSPHLPQSGLQPCAQACPLGSATVRQDGLHPTQPHAAQASRSELVCLGCAMCPTTRCCSIPAWPPGYHWVWWGGSAAQRNGHFLRP